MSQPPTTTSTLKDTILSYSRTSVRPAGSRRKQLSTVLVDKDPVALSQTPSPRGFICDRCASEIQWNSIVRLFLTGNHINYVNIHATKALHVHRSYTYACWNICIFCKVWTLIYIRTIPCKLSYNPSRISALRALWWPCKTLPQHGHFCCWVPSPGPCALSPQKCTWLAGCPWVVRIGGEFPDLPGVAFQ